MPIYTDSFNNNLHFNLDSNIHINNLHIFKKSLEKCFLSEVTVRKCSLNRNQCDLAIEVKFNSSLEEMISCQLNKDAVRNEPTPNSPDTCSAFFTALSCLYSENSVELDIAELAIYLKDTSIIIEKIYAQSIPDQLENLLKAIGTHYEVFSNPKEKPPFEIYIPVFEEDTFEMENTLRNISSGNNNQTDYFGFWGLYYESEEDAVIYDLANKVIHMGDLFMLNH